MSVRLLPEVAQIGHNVLAELRVCDSRCAAVPSLVHPVPVGLGVLETQEMVLGRVGIMKQRRRKIISSIDMSRTLKGTYVAVEPFHMDRYFDEQIFRFNNRIKTDDATRFSKVVTQIVGKRLTYAELTGKGEEKRAIAF